MGRFAEPIDAIRDYSDLKIGDELWSVCGVWPPFVDNEPRIVASLPMKFKDHPEFSEPSSQGNQIVYDVRYSWHAEGESTMRFTADDNMVPGYSHNDNYVFRTKDAADGFAAWLRYEWMKRPDLIAEQRLISLAHEYDEPYFDDYQDEAP